MKQKVLLTLATALTSFVLISLGAIASLQMQHAEVPTLLKTAPPIPQTQDDSLFTLAPTVPSFASFTPSGDLTSYSSSDTEISASQSDHDAASVVTNSVQVASDGAVDNAIGVAVTYLPPTAVRAPRVIVVSTARPRIVVVRPVVTVKPPAISTRVSSPKPVVTPRPVVTRQPDNIDWKPRISEHDRYTPSPRTHDTNSPTDSAPEPMDN